MECGELLPLWTTGPGTALRRDLRAIARELAPTSEDGGRVAATRPGIAVRCCRIGVLPLELMSNLRFRLFLR
jgi:hypothetical protein